MTGFLDRLAAHAQGTAPVLRLRPRARFEDRGPGTRAPVDDEFPVDEPLVPPDEPPSAEQGPMSESAPHTGQRVETRPRPGRVAPDGPAAVTPASRRPAAAPGDLRLDLPVAPHTATAGGTDAPNSRRSTRTATPQPHDTAGPADRRPGAPSAPATGHHHGTPPPVAAADPAPRRPDLPHTSATARRPARHHPDGEKAMAGPTQLDPPARTEAAQEPADGSWPSTAEVGHRLTSALRDAGLLASASGREAPTLRWPTDALPTEADLARLGPAARTGQDVHLHVHLDRVEVVHPPPPAPTIRRVDPPPRRRPAPSKDHDAYLARRREDRR